MEELLPCPFCGGKAEIFDYDPDNDVGYHEPYTAQCSNECCCLGKDFRTREEAAEAWNRRARQEQLNEPLTLEELREMDGEPVWCVDTDGMHPGLLCYVECVLDDGKEAHIWLLDHEGNVGRYNVRCMIECGAKFYRRKPEQEESN